MMFLQMRTITIIILINNNKTLIKYKINKASKVSIELLIIMLIQLLIINNK